jgi:hypothetical protein
MYHDSGLELDLYLIILENLDALHKPPDQVVIKLSYFVENNHEPSISPEHTDVDKAFVVLSLGWEYIGRISFL